MATEEMKQKPPQLPEGALLRRAREHQGLSIREAAPLAQVSEGRWRQIEAGYQTVTAGTYAPVRASAGRLATMAAALGISPGDLRQAGRDDAADELETMQGTRPAARTVRPIRMTDVDEQRELFVHAAENASPAAVAAAYETARRFLEALRQETERD